MATFTATPTTTPVATGTIQSLAIVTAIREALESLSYGDTAFAGLTGMREAIEAIGAPQAEVELRSVGISSATPLHPPGSMRLYELELEVRVVRAVSARQQLSADLRAAMRASVIDDAVTVAAALVTPQALVQTAAGTPTRLVGGRLRHGGSAAGDIEFDGDNSNGRFVTTHRFTALAEGV